MFGFLADAITSTVSVLLPVFGAYKAIRTRDASTLTVWLIYWTTLALVLLAESHFYFFLRWLPLYSWIRLAMYVYLVAPGQKHGSFFIYKEYIYPFLYRHEAQIEQLINDSNSRAFAVGWDLFLKGIQFVQVRVLRHNDVVSSVNKAARYDKRLLADHMPHRLDGRPRERTPSRFEDLGSDDDVNMYRDPPNHYDFVQQTRKDDPFSRTTYTRPSITERGGNGSVAANKADALHTFDTKGREDMLIRSAMDRISHAKATGRVDPNLSWEEIEALGRRASQQLDGQRAPITPPATPARQKAKDCSRSNSSSSLSSKSKKPHNAWSTPTSTRTKSTRSSKLHQKPSPEKLIPDQGLSYMMGNSTDRVEHSGYKTSSIQASSMHGLPVEFISSPSRSPSLTSTGSLESPFSLEREDLRGHFAPNASRPQSSSSLQSLPEVDGWTSSRLRQSSMSSHSPYSTRHTPDDYINTSTPPQHQWRSVSGPPEIYYSSVHRLPTSPSKQGGKIAGLVSNSDSHLFGSKSSHLRREFDPLESSSDEPSDESAQRTSNEDGRRESNDDDTSYEVEVKSYGPKGHYPPKTSIVAPSNSAMKRKHRKPKGKRK